MQKVTGALIPLTYVSQSVCFWCSCALQIADWSSVRCRCHSELRMLFNNSSAHEWPTSSLNILNSYSHIEFFVMLVSTSRRIFKESYLVGCKNQCKTTAPPGLHRTGWPPLLYVPSVCTVCPSIIACQSSDRYMGRASDSWLSKANEQTRFDGQATLNFTNTQL